MTITIKRKGETTGKRRNVQKQKNEIFKLSQEEQYAARNMAEQMKQYQWRTAFLLYSAITLTIKFLNIMTESGIKPEDMPRIVLAASVVDCVEREENEFETLNKEGGTKIVKKN